MNPVRATLLARDVQHQSIHQFLKVGPEQLLAEVAPGAKWQAQDAGLGAEGLAVDGVVSANPAILDAASDDL